MGQSPKGNTYSKVSGKYILVQGNSDIKNGWVYPRIWTTQKTKIARAGDLIMSVRAPAGTIAKTKYDVVLGRGVASIEGNEFLFQYLFYLDQHRYWEKYSTGSTFDSLNYDAIYSASVYMTSSKEQNLMGDFLLKIDNLITLHQRKFRVIFITV